MMRQAKKSKMKTMSSLEKWPVNVSSLLFGGLILGLGCFLLPVNQAIATAFTPTQSPDQLIHSELTHDPSNIPEASQETTAAEITQLFDEAKRYRGTDGAKSSTILKRLEELRHSFSQEQAYYLDYLQAYQQNLLGETDRAIATLLHVFNNTQSTELKFQSGYTIFNVLAIARRFVEALSYYNQTMALYSQISDSELKISVNLAAMMLFNELGDYPKVLTIAEELQLTLLPEHLECKASSMKIRAESNINPLLNDVSTFKNALQGCTASKQPLFESFIRLYYVRFLLANSQYLQALTELETHLPTSLSTQYQLIIQEYYYLMAKTHWHLGREQDAKDYTDLALAIRVENNYSLPLTLTLAMRYEIEKKAGNLEQALFYGEQYFTADKAYLNQVRVKAQAIELNKAESLEHKRHITALEQENRLMSLQQALDATEKSNTRLLLIILLLGLFCLSLWAYKTKILQKQLARLALIDELTQVFNRRQFVTLGTQILTMNERAGQSACVIMIDLDQFKAINDQFGHSVGDWVLKRVASKLNSLGRRSDVFGRLGGEEFAYVLGDCAMEKALEFAEMCRQAVEALDVSESAYGASLTLSASFGVTATRFSGYDLERLLADADESLYQAKGNNRNCVVAFEPATPELYIAPLTA
jgi:diguanylate cyclase (GGDEF)-like protein